MRPPHDLLEEVAQSLAGEDGCCQIRNPDGRCCFTDKARDVLQIVEKRSSAGQWQTIDEIPANNRPKLIAFANGSVCIAPGISSPSEIAGAPPPDAGWRPTFWMYVPKAPLQ